MKALSLSIALVAILAAADASPTVRAILTAAVAIGAAVGVLVFVGWRLER